MMQHRNEACRSFLFPASAGMNRATATWTELPRSCDEPGGRYGTLFPASAGMNRLRLWRSEHTIERPSQWGSGPLFPASAGMNRPAFQSLVSDSE